MHKSCKFFPHQSGEIQKYISKKITTKTSVNDKSYD